MIPAGQPACWHLPQWILYLALKTRWHFAAGLRSRCRLVLASVAVPAVQLLFAQTIVSYWVVSDV